MRRLVLLGSVLLLLTAGCIHANIPQPTLRPTRTPVVPTVVPTATATATETPIATEAATEAASTEDAADGALPGDPVEGEHLFHTFQPEAGMACTTCHRTDSDERLVGPGLKTVGIRAQTRVPGMSASQYIHTSIVNPSAYVVDGFPDIMPKNWGKVFTEAQLDDLVAYLVSLSR